jgi:uncharacterized protein YdeI (YjbR/CyaY-like superfamily)
MMPSTKSRSQRSIVRLPRDVSEALDKTMLKKFRAMPPSHQKEWLRVIAEAKKAETRQSRIAKLVAKMRAND